MLNPIYPRVALSALGGCKFQNGTPSEAMFSSGQIRPVPLGEAD
jgi:hypothetical protein